MNVRDIPIQKYLPYKAPFLMIDRVLELEKNKRILCLKNLSHGEAFWVETHYPGTPIFPGALMMEAMAQAAALLVNLSEDLVDDGKIGVLCKVELKYYDLALPGDQLRLDVQKVGAYESMWKMQAKALVGDKLCCSGLISGARRAPGRTP